MFICSTQVRIKEGNGAIAPGPRLKGAPRDGIYFK